MLRLVFDTLFTRAKLLLKPWPEPKSVEGRSVHSIQEDIAALLDALAFGSSHRERANDLSDPYVRETILPLAAVAARGRDDYQVFAELVDAYLIEILENGNADATVQRRIEILDLVESFNVLCYVGFRRAKLVSALPMLDLLRKLARAVVHVEGDEPLTRDQFKYVGLILQVARFRFDTIERTDYANLSLELFDTIVTRGQAHLDIHEIYHLVRLFAYPARVHPASYEPFISRVRRLLDRYFAEERSPLLAGDNVVKEAALATVAGRHEYGRQAVQLLTSMHDNEIDPQKARKIAQRLVEVAYHAGYDDVYGLWGTSYLRLLLNNKYNTYHRFIIGALMRFGRNARAQQQILRVGRRHPRMLLQEAIAMRNLSNFDQALQTLDAVRHNIEERLTGSTRILSRAGKDNFPATSLLWAERLRDELAYIQEFERLSRPKKEDPGPAPEGDLIVLCPSSFYAFLQISPHVMAELRGKGASLISLVPGFIVSDPVNADIDAHVTNSIAPHYYTDSVSLTKCPSNQWIVDFSAKKAELNGINFYYCLHNTLGITFRCYDIAWGNPIVRSYVDRYMTAIESLFEKHARIAEHCRASGRRARFVLTEIQHGLAHALRIISERLDSSDVIEVFHLSNGFEAYHDGIEKLEQAQFQCIANVTRHPEVSLAYRPAASTFEAWLRSAPEAERASAAARIYSEKVLDAARNARERDAEHIILAKRKSMERFPGAPVIVLLGKILPDLPRPDDVGFIHEDVRAWFIDACITAHRLKVNLVVKPHPAEFSSLIALYVNQDFLSFIEEVPVEARPIVVDRHSMPITDLPHLVDGVMLWGGNSMVELGLLGLPTMVSGKYGASDCPVGLHVSDTREAFESFLAGRFPQVNTEVVRNNTVAFLSYVTDERHTIPAAFNNRSMYNSEIWPPRFSLSSINGEVTEGARRMADYILGDERATIPKGLNES